MNDPTPPAFGTVDPFDHLPPVDRLRAIMHRLRAPGGCPWDAEQTHESLLPHLIEEAYEVAEAVRDGDRDAMVDELGDLLLQPVFHAEIGAESGAFTFDDIAAAIGDKLIRRHPHVFGDSDAADPETVLRQWNAIKRTEKGASAAEPQTPEPYLKDSNQGHPALMNAARIQKRAAKTGFDWPEHAGDSAATLGPVLAKIREETDEIEAELATGDPDRIAEEIGDLLFSVVNLARKQQLEPELLLHRANLKFVRRFRRVEDDLRARGRTLEEASLEEMDAAWEAAKAAAE